MILSYRFSLRPTPRQVGSLNDMLDAFRELYNAGLQQRIEAYQRQGKTLSYLNQVRELKAVREVDERLRGFSFTAEMRVLRRLDQAFHAFFRRAKGKKAKAGFPRFKGLERYHAADFKFGDGLTLRGDGRVGIVGVDGGIRVRWHRALPSRPISANVSRRAGKWHISFQVEVDAAEPGSHPGPEVGIDAGITNLVALSTGEVVRGPQFERDASKELRRRWRALNRCRQGSGGRAKRKLALARTYAKVAAQRRDFIHKVTANLSRRFGVLVFEDLNVRALARSRLAKGVHNAAWGMLRGFADYKAEKAGGLSVTVDPRGTSQECVCGAAVPKTLAERLHVCPCCGAVEDRDVMAGKVILARHLRGHGTCLGMLTGRGAA